MRPAKPDLDCCTPVFLAHRPSGAAWCHGSGCAAKRAGERVLSPDLEARIARVRKQATRPIECGWHYPYEYLVADVCDGPRCSVYRAVWSDGEDDVRDVRNGAWL